MVSAVTNLEDKARELWPTFCKSQGWLHVKASPIRIAFACTVTRSILAELEKGEWLRCKDGCASLRAEPIPFSNASDFPGMHASDYKWRNCGLPCTCGNPMKAAKEAK